MKWIAGPHFPINCNVKPQDDGTHIATYIPEEPGPHRVHVRLDGKDIDGKYLCRCIMNSTQFSNRRCIKSLSRQK